jgi:imidazolonepropionase-like amidohydrolase
MDADLVVLSDDPVQSTTAFSKARCTIRGGKVIYAEKRNLLMHAIRC